MKWWRCSVCRVPQPPEAFYHFQLTDIVGRKRTTRGVSGLLSTGLDGVSCLSLLLWSLGRGSGGLLLEVFILRGASCGSLQVVFNLQGNGGARHVSLRVIHLCSQQVMIYGGTTQAEESQQLWHGRPLVAKATARHYLRRLVLFISLKLFNQALQYQSWYCVPYTGEGTCHFLTFLMLCSFDVYFFECRSGQIRKSGTAMNKLQACKPHFTGSALDLQGSKPHPIHLERKLAGKVGLLPRKLPTGPLLPHPAKERLESRSFAIQCYWLSRYRR